MFHQLKLLHHNTYFNSTECAAQYYRIIFFSFSTCSNQLSALTKLSNLKVGPNFSIFPTSFMLVHSTNQGTCIYSHESSFCFKKLYYYVPWSCCFYASFKFLPHPWHFLDPIQTDLTYLFCTLEGLYLSTTLCQTYTLKNMSET